MKIASIVGARPEFIKEVPLSKELRRKHDEIIIHTGQHYDYEMSKIFFNELKIPEPDYNLNVGSGSQGWQTAQIIIKLEKVLLKEKPDLVLVYGDTNSTMAGAIAASKSGMMLAHVESGMRIHDKSLPEEINRVVTDHLSDALFCSTKTAVQNLSNEGIVKNVFNTGDVMIDIIKENISITEKKSKILEKLRLRKKNYVLATIHRANNTDNKKNISSIIEAFLESKERILFPIHPRTEKLMKKYGIYNKIKNTNITATKPLGYFDMLKAEKNARKILTDSGGIQKEAYFLKVPCITIRSSTEWIETVNDGWNILTGANKPKILHAIRNFNPKSRQNENYGNGKASKNIVNVISRLSSH